VPQALTSDAPRLQAPRPSQDGFHVGLGLGGFGFWFLAYEVQLTGQVFLDWTWGRVGLRVAPTFRSTWAGIDSLGASWHGSYVSATVDTQVRLNLGRVVAIGAGVETGALLVRGLPDGRVAFFVLGPSLSPAILRLADRGQHQLSLSGSRLFSFPPISQDAFPFSPAPGALNVSLSYSLLL
jgi:hypothetical protein